MTDPAMNDPARGLASRLNDLLQLDYDAVGAYTVAMAALRDPSLREALSRHRADHERHIQDLTALVESIGGVPARLPHIPTGFLKLATQAMAAGCGDAVVLLAFKTNEGQVRSKYARYARRPHPPEVDEVLRRGAEDEERHYAWVSDELERLGLGPGTAARSIGGLAELFHGAMADFLEAAGRGAMHAAARGGRAAVTVPRGR